MLNACGAPCWDGSGPTLTTFLLLLNSHSEAFGACDIKNFRGWWDAGKEMKVGLPTLMFGKL